MKNKSLFIFNLLVFINVSLIVNSQTHTVQYLDPGFKAGSINYLRFGDNDHRYGGIGYINNYAGFGDGNDVSIFTYGNRDLTFLTGTGNFIIFPSSGGNVGIGTTSPNAKLHIQASNMRGLYLEQTGNQDWGYAGGRWNSKAPQAGGNK